MNKLFGLIATSCAFALLPATATAQSAASAAMAKAPHLADCGKAGANKAECEGYNKAMLACVKATDPVAHRECMEDNMPAPDCAKAADPARCAMVLAARESCRGRYGPERAKCMKDKAPAGAPGGKKS